MLIAYLRTRCHKGTLGLRSSQPDNEVMLQCIYAITIYQSKKFILLYIAPRKFKTKRYAWFMWTAAERFQI